MKSVFPADFFWVITEVYSMLVVGSNNMFVTFYLFNFCVSEFMYLNLYIKDILLPKVNDLFQTTKNNIKEKGG